MSNWLLEYVIPIIVAIAIWDISVFIVKWYFNRDKDVIKCDLCHKPRITYKTKDQRYWACKKCRLLYNKEKGVAK